MFNSEIMEDYNYAKEYADYNEITMNDLETFSKLFQIEINSWN